eukprot:TRINITY_DN12855_c0_g1_i1.p1 TRINITY_DN12855_c0_g1~~TRINITY_DN12855_c0_g1_i1.p1  ORF type:complete len:157 (+),score=25.17 TRINITY_DN12855_c0_g1_i1:1-471(+)
MCVTTEVKGVHKLKGSERLDKLKSLNTDGSSQIMPNQKRGVTYISRLQCVQAAVENYIKKLSVENPDKVVGLVTFNNEVIIVGDGFKSANVVTGDKLNDYDTLLNIGKKTKVGKPISKSYAALHKHLFSIEESGATALGPALLISLGIASKKKDPQ